MSEKKPIRTRRYKDSNGHALETRVFAREIHETYCADRRCKFFGKHAAQGRCHSRLKPHVLKELDRRNKYAWEAVREIQHIAKNWSKAKYIRYLESQHVCDVMNTWFSLDELIRLRAENAELRLKIGTYK